MIKEVIVPADDLVCLGKDTLQELIRCKDCKHWDGCYCHNKWWGDGYGNYTPPIKAEDGFCDWAERKEVEFAKVIRCKDCRYFGERMLNGYWSCGRREGCVMTIPEGFCGWAIRRKENG